MYNIRINANEEQKPENQIENLWLEGRIKSKEFISRKLKVESDCRQVKRNISQSVVKNKLFAG
jgi:hypothetical protein